MQKLFTNELNHSKKNKNKWDQTQILKKFDTLHMQIKTVLPPCHVLGARVVALRSILSQHVASLAQRLVPHQLGWLAVDCWSVISFNDVIILTIY